MTQFPIDVTVDRLVEFHGLADVLCQAELGRLPSHTTGDPVGEIIELMALQGQTGEQIQAWLHEEPEAIAYRTIPPLPPIPTRDQVCNGQTTQQGLIVTTTQFGAMPWWGACWGWLNAQSRKEAAAQLLANKDTICLIGVPSGPALYDEPNQFYSADKFPPLAMTDAEVAAMVEEALRLGFSAVWLFLSGDDGAKGYEVAIAQTRRLGPALGALNAYVLQVPGWDGVWHQPDPVNGTGYTPAMVQAFAAEARAAGAVYVGLEHGTGYLPLGEGGRDFQPGGQMTGYDVILGEFMDGQFNDTVWQVLGRMIRPYHRPPDQPANDDPNPPFYLGVEGPRGPYVYRVFEFCIYGWVRGTSAAQVQAWREYFQNCGAVNVC